MPVRAARWPKAVSNAYLHGGAKLWCGDSVTTASGIPPVILRLSLADGDRLVLTTDLTPVDVPEAGQVARIGCTLPAAVAAMRPGDPVLFDDGTIAAVRRVGRPPARPPCASSGPNRAGNASRAEKGINLPDTDAAGAGA